MFEYFVLLLHIFLHCYFFFFHSYNIIILLTIFFHFLCFINPPQCYSKHCQPKYHKLNDFNIPTTQNPIHQLFSEEKQDQIQQKVLQTCCYCGLTKWIRMNHCHRCKTCVHKLDHHCVLLGICIGEKNQKYYILFLWTFLYTSIKQLITYFYGIKKHIFLDMITGNQNTDWNYCLFMILTIFYLLSSLVVAYLCIFHTHMIIYNDTTYEKKKGGGIWYLKGLQNKKHPFDEGIITNFKLIFIRAGKNPIQWWNPSANQTYKTFQI